MILDSECDDLSSLWLSMRLSGQKHSNLKWKATTSLRTPKKQQMPPGDAGGKLPEAEIAV
ncbi:MAG: hypothetical protein CMJ64_13215 [Planctomycetaceae bacterium]|nr:hypothetical protein [Planctomycetaceae bacterium]